MKVREIMLVVGGRLVQRTFYSRVVVQLASLQDFKQSWNSQVGPSVAIEERAVTKAVPEGVTSHIRLNIGFCWSLTWGWWDGWLELSQPPTCSSWSWRWVNFYFMDWLVVGGGMVGGWDGGGGWASAGWACGWMEVGGCSNYKIRLSTLVGSWAWQVYTITVESFN